jgi:hypothetical protein
MEQIAIVSYGAGFRAPAFSTVGNAPGPALESLPRRNPRGRLGAVWRARRWGFEDRGRLVRQFRGVYSPLDGS